MVAVIVNGGFLYRPTLIHHMTDASGNIVVFDTQRGEYILAHPGENGQTEYMDSAEIPLTRPMFLPPCVLMKTGNTSSSQKY